MRYFSKYNKDITSHGVEFIGQPVSN
ncbi:hypothetical protein CAEBREN_19811 [Caenorhabditis brenneri]|uniref:Uncharacterized protein n=1 Tax=Caenorhabditis brenneri TaxID=135651 RepID=G0PI37_CAEBE|nr:hypothetical protein CAEBREN_19811 [Caenorhabditis brenneri]